MTYTDAQFLALFEPRGVVVAGASTHPGKFGFVTLHNLLRHDYPGRVFATSLSGDEVLGIPTLTSLDQLPGARPTWSSCAPPWRPTPTCCGRARPGASGPPS